jgi:hypothetical protein
MKYIHNRHNWKLILEARDNRKKIKKFIGNDDIVNWAHEIDNNYSIWIANTFKDELIKDIEAIDDGEQWSKQEIMRLIKTGEPIPGDKRKLNFTINDRIKRMMNLLTPKYRYVIDWTNGRMRDAEVRENLKGMSLEEAWQKSDEWHKALAEGEHVIIDEEGEIIMTFKDDFYWIDLETSSCSEEGKAMGHCGSTSYGTTLYSLRKNKKPYVTIAYNEDRGMITQIKGRANEKPKEKYHPYIVDLLINPDVGVEGFEYEYNPQEDFQISDLNSELFEKLFKNNSRIRQNAKGHTMMVLLSRGIVTKQEATAGLEDLTYDEETDELYIMFSEWGDLGEVVFEDSNDRRTQGFATEILNHEYDSALWFNRDEKFDFSDHWDYLTVDTLEMVKETIIEKQTGDFYTPDGDQIEFTFTEDNLIVDEYEKVQKILGEKVHNPEKKKKNKIGGMYVSIDDEIFNMADILKENKDGDLEDVVDMFDRAANDAYEWSVQTKWFDIISEKAISAITDSRDKEDKTRYKWFDNILGVRFNLEHVMDIIENDTGDDEAYNYDNVAEMLTFVENDDFKISFIREDVWGDIEDEINEALVQALY